MGNGLLKKVLVGAKKMIEPSYTQRVGEGMSFGEGLSPSKKWGELAGVLLSKRSKFMNTLIKKIKLKQLTL